MHCYRTGIIFTTPITSLTLLFCTFHYLSLPFTTFSSLSLGSVGEVPIGDYEIPLGKANVVLEGSDVTLVGWGNQMNVLTRAAEHASNLGISCELVDLRSLLPWDRQVRSNARYDNLPYYPLCLIPYTL